MYNKSSSLRPIGVKESKIGNIVMFEANKGCKK